MQILLQDIRYAIRQLRKSPGFTIVAVLTLALGIGANTAIYSIIHGALRLPYPNSERMVAIENVYPQGKYFSASYPDFEQWRAQSKVFSPIVATAARQMTWTGHGNPESLSAEYVSEGFFNLYGLQPVAGRSFLAAEHQKGAAQVCVLSEKFWREKLSSDPSIVGKPINLNGTAYTVVGVAPAPQNSTRLAQLWIPIEPAPPMDKHGWNYLFVDGLLRPGVTLDQAQAELRSIQGQIDKQFPDNTHGVELHPLSEATFGDLHTILLVLQAAVGFILLIACVNLANMLLARAANRAREFSIRRALGASPKRMVQQTLTESLLLSLAGAALGLTVAEGLTHVPIAAWPKNFVPPSSVHLDGMVLVFTLLLAVGTGVLFGAIPALRILKQDEKDALLQGRTVTESHEQNRTRSALVIAEVALSMLLVAGALNMTFYFIHLLKVDPGINPENTMAMTVSLSPAQYAKPADQSRFFGTLEQKLAALPGVTHVGVSDDTPFTASGSNGDFTYDGQPEITAHRNPFADYHYVSPGYFEAVGTTLLQGRGFTPSDTASGQKVIIIDRRTAQRLWPGQSALGKHILCCESKENLTVIGVAANVRFSGPAAKPDMTFYLSQDQFPDPVTSVIVRTHGNPLELAKAAQHVVASIDPLQAVSDITTLNALEQKSIAGQRTSTMITAILGCLALLLASIGVYGVMAYSVSRREREFGIRMALGADRSSIVKLLFVGMLRLTAIGMLIGAGLALGLRATMQASVDSLLGASGTNPLALLIAGSLLCAVAALATLIPARHAMNVEPMQALHTE
jgi:putative ABC transport system permease protein